MPDLTYNIIVVPTYDLYTLAVKDISTYSIHPVIGVPTLNINIPGFDTVVVDFTPEDINVYNSTQLGISTSGNEEYIPDGIYCIKYYLDDSLLAEKTILRVDRLQQKFDEAFMQLDMMECDRAIKTQSKVDLNTIYFFIQGAIASANNCATVESTKLYNRANTMLDGFLNTNCNCSGNNFVINFQYT